MNCNSNLPYQLQSQKVDVDQAIGDCSLHERSKFGGFCSAHPTKRDETSGKLAYQSACVGAWRTVQFVVDDVELAHLSQLAKLCWEWTCAIRSPVPMISIHSQYTGEGVL